MPGNASESEATGHILRREPKYVSPNITSVQKNPSDFAERQNPSAFFFFSTHQSWERWTRDCRQYYRRCIFRILSLQVQPTCLSRSWPINPDTFFISFRSLLSLFNISPTLSSLGGSRKRKIKIVPPRRWIIRVFFFLPLSVKFYQLPNFVVRFFIS